MSRPDRPGPAESRGTLLSHHAIMQLVAPFSRRGYRVDLAASDRTNGKLAFRAVDVPAGADGRPALYSVLRFEKPHRLKVRIVRTLESRDGRQATMTAEGDDIDALLDAIEAMDPSRHFHMTDTGLVTRSYRSEVWRVHGPPRQVWQKGPAWPRLTGAEAPLGSLRLVAEDRGGHALEVRVEAPPGATLDVPPDLLMVLGPAWRPLHAKDSSTAVGSVLPGGGGAARTKRLEALFDRAAMHLAGNTPRRFHARHRGARWGATLLRMAPLLYLVSVTTAFAVAVSLLPKTPANHMLMQLVSLPAIGGLFVIAQVYRFELPRPPRPLRQDDWIR